MLKEPLLARPPVLAEEHLAELAMAAEGHGARVAIAVLLCSAAGDPEPTWPSLVLKQ